MIFLNGREKVLNPFKGNTSPIKVTGRDGLEQASSTLSEIPLRKQTQETGHS